MLEEQPIKRQRLIRKPQPIKVSSTSSSSIAYYTDDDNNYNNNEEEEEEIVYYNRPKTTIKRQQTKYPSSSPEPNSPLNNNNKRKKICADPNRKDKIGRTRIFSATTAGHLDKVQELIALGADVNFQDNANWTPLHEAASHGRFEIAQLLINHGAKINVRGYGLETPLHDACQSNSPLIVKLLVDGGANVFALNESNKRPIDLCPHNEACQDILKAKMKELDHVIKRDVQGKSLLHHACLENEYQRAQDLISQGADVNAKDNQDMTPLHYACAKGHLKLVQLLFRQGALVNITANATKQGDTPLHQASRNGQTQVVDYLIQKAEANVNKKNKQGHDAYQVSAKFPPVRQLLTAKMDELKLEKEACNALDDTARKMALQNEPERQLTREEKKIQQYMKQFAKMSGEVPAANENDKLLDELLEHSPPAQSSSTLTTTKRRKRTSSTTINTRKSVSVERDLSASPTTAKRSPVSYAKLDPFKRDSSGSTLLHKYAMRGDCQAIKSLLNSGAEPNAKDNAGWTALHEAALKGHVQVVRILLENGADVNSKGADMDTPLHDATENNHCEIVQMLLDHGADPLARNIHDAEPVDIATQHGFQDIVMVLQQHATVANQKKKKKRPKLSLVLDEEDDEDEEYQEDVASEELQRQTRRSSKRSSITATTTTTNTKRKRRLIQKDEEDEQNSDDDETLIAPSSRSSSPPSSPSIPPRRTTTLAKLKKLHQRKRSLSPEFKLEPNQGQGISTTLLSDGNTTSGEEEDEEQVRPTFPSDDYDSAPETDEDEEEEREKENIHRTERTMIPNKKKLPIRIDNNITHYKYASTSTYPYNHHNEQQPCSPVYTPPPEQLQQKKIYSPLYTVQLFPAKHYLIDLQVCLFLGIDNLNDYVCLSNQKISVNTSTKSRLYNTLKFMLNGQDKSQFMNTTLYFVDLDEIVDIIKRDFSHLVDHLLTITLDIGSTTTTEEKEQEEETISTSCNTSRSDSSSSLSPPLEKKLTLPPKMALKKMMKAGQYKFQK